MPNQSNSLRWSKVKKVGESLVAEVFLARNERTEETFLIKQIQANFNHPELKNLLQQQLNHFKYLAIPGLIIPHLDIDQDENIRLSHP
ncbi:MAG: hypothetical protein KUG79_14930 [Pseudomonadales bacterium]|nr:hypothetical protein [Pseudomonadales bacterium]